MSGLEYFTLKHYNTSATNKNCRAINIQMKEILRYLYHHNHKTIAHFLKGYVNEMSITSTQPSTLVSDFKSKAKVADKAEILSGMQWQEEISEENVFMLLEKRFYPFKNVSEIGL